jgi:23S rRNA (uridine2552-2'-O)-methyltransferase
MNRFKLHDHYFEEAKKAGFKARSVFKLKEINDSLKIIKPNSIVLDLGAAPGSWLQYVAQILGTQGAVLGIDLQEIPEKFHPRIKTVQQDCFLLDEIKVKELMADLVADFKAFDLVLSDMAPKTTGIKHLDQIRSMELAEKALSIAELLLKKGGHVVIKVFGSGELKDLLLRMKKSFRVVKEMRPKSVRSPSKELYVVGLHKL